LTTGPYTSLGKEVLRDGKHFADVIDVDSAAVTADALNYRHAMLVADDDRNDDTPDMFEGPDVPMMHGGSRHHVRQENDEYACSCGMRWSVVDGEEHP